MIRATFDRARIKGQIMVFEGCAKDCFDYARRGWISEVVRDREVSMFRDRMAAAHMMLDILNSVADDTRPSAPSVGNGALCIR
jgi:hypothetical protein